MARNTLSPRWRAACHRTDEAHAQERHTARDARRSHRPVAAVEGIRGAIKEQADKAAHRSEPRPVGANRATTKDGLVERRQLDRAR